MAKKGWAPTSPDGGNKCARGCKAFGYGSYAVVTIPVKVLVGLLDFMSGSLTEWSELSRFDPTQGLPQSEAKVFEPPQKAFPATDPQGESHGLGKVAA